MFPSHCFKCCAVFFGLMLCLTASASDEARQSFGQGVHLLYEGRLSEALSYFDAASHSLRNDPRLFYFRGIANQRLGRRQEAAADFRYAARLEAAFGRTDVGRALQRIQGAERLTIERYRRSARQLASAGGQRSLRQAAETLPEPGTRPQPRRVAVSEVPRLQNLANDPSDPFSVERAVRLGRGAIQAAAQETTDEVAEASTAESADDEPLGSGFDATAQDDPFPAEFPDDDSFADDAQPPRRERGVLGAVLRAVTRSSLPTEQGQRALDGLRQAVPGQGADDAMSESGEFADDIQDTTSVDDPFATDPFAEASDPLPEEDAFAEDEDDGAAATDPFADNDDSDPFADSADDGDPFADSAGDGDSDAFADENADDNTDETDPFADDPFADDQ